jgi:chorismate mutase/prephenate dehydratase
MSDLKKLRATIDTIDGQIVGLLKKRTQYSRQIHAFKSQKNIGKFSPEREREVYAHVMRLGKGMLPAESLEAIYREIMSMSLALERPLCIAYLGPEATFTHIASMRKFGRAVTYQACSSITEVFEEVEKARCDYGVVPVENSIEGAVTHTFDMLVDYELNVCSEILLEIRHNLLSKGSLAQVKKIYSKAEVFSQCRKWLESNLPRAELIATSSTSKAAQCAAQSKTNACIASELAGQMYALKTVASSIEDSAHNVTRFLVIGNYYSDPTGDDKTSLVFSIKDRVGALHDMLMPFKKNHINLMMIESRPSKKKAWDYYFFLDVAGHINEQKIKKSIDELEDMTRYLKVLGSYPIAKTLRAL